MKEKLFNYLSSNTGALTVEDVLFNFLIAATLGMVVYLSYRLTHSGTAYSASFNVTLVKLTLITTLVMNVIGNNVALSLGMVGALSIVRFRTAIKNPRDTTYIFWCIAVGICCGVSEYMIAGIGTAVIFLFSLLFGRVISSDRYLLVIRASREACADIEKQVTTTFKSDPRIRVQNTTKSTVEYIYELSEKMLTQARKSGDPVKFLYQVEGVSTVNIVSQNDEINR